MIRIWGNQWKEGKYPKKIQLRVSQLKGSGNEKTYKKFFFVGGGGGGDMRKRI